MTPPRIVGALVLGLALAGLPAPVSGGDAVERLDRFQRLAAAGLGGLELSGHEVPAAILHELFALLDEEILDSLRSGDLFASEGFLQERLDGFSAVWGGAALRVLSLEGGGLTVGAFQLSPGGRASSVRVYERSGGRAELLRVIAREGAPVLERMPPTRAGAPQFLVGWVGPPDSRGRTGLRVELWRRRGDSVGLAWSTDPLAEGRLLVSRFSLAGREVSFRYEVRYPGWKPGCDGQTEHEDFYRYDAGRETFLLARRRVVNGWHRELQAAVGGLLAALNGRDEGALAAVVPDDAVRRRLPRRLEPDLACDAPAGPAPRGVAVGAVAPDDGRPWTLLFERSARGWRLTAAVPLESGSVTMIE